MMNRRLKEIRVVVKKTKKSSVKEFNVRRRLTDDLEVYAGSADAATHDLKEGYENKAYLLAQSLFTIEGIEWLEVEGYTVTVYMGKAFHWREDKVEEKVKIAIQQYLIDFLQKEKLLKDIGIKKKKKT